MQCYEKHSIKCKFFSVSSKSGENLHKLKSIKLKYVNCSTFRDVFYELVREWEDSHLAAGWNMEEHMGDRIRYRPRRVFTLYTLMLVCIFSILFSIHSYGTDKENLFNNQELQLVIIFLILVTSMCD